MTGNIDDSHPAGETATEDVTIPSLTPKQNEPEIPIVLAEAVSTTATTVTATITTTTKPTTDTVDNPTTMTTASEPPKPTTIKVALGQAISNPTNTTTGSSDNTSSEHDFTDNGIFDFMSPELAIKLYQRIHSQGVPDLEWKFYGRRDPIRDSGELDAKGNQCDNIDGTPSKDRHEHDASGNTLDNTEFDFDETFPELQAETSAISDSLKLKNRPEPGSERKANLSDIMSNILKETSHTETG